MALDQGEVGNKLVSTGTDSMEVLARKHEEVSEVLIQVEVWHVANTCLHSNQF